MPSMWVFDEASFGEIVRGKFMSHLQPPEPQPSMNSAHTTYGRPREGRPSLPLQQNTQQAQYPEYQPQQYPHYESQAQYPQPSLYPEGPQAPQYPQNPQYPQGPQYQPPQLQSTRITQNPPLQQSTRTTQPPASYKQTPTYPPYRKQLQPYPAESPRKKYSQWLLPRRDYSRWIIVTLASGVLALVLIGVLTVASANGNSTARTGSQSTHTIGTGSQTGATTGHTGRPGTQPIFAPVLGGTISDFALQYGIAEDPSNNEAGLWQHITIAGQSVSLSVSTAPPQDSQDSDLHIMNLIVQTSSNGTWNAATQQHIMAALLPSDAKLLRQVSTDNGNETIYTSAQLASTFQASLFTTGTGKSVTPGTFNEQCFLAGTAVRAGGAATTCWLTVGEI
jgi:hypothetical protein